MSSPRKTSTNVVDHEFRIGFLGSCGVGKSSILKQLVGKQFMTEYKPTLEVDLDFVAKYNGSTYVCLLIDTGGQDDFPAMRKLCISRSNAFAVVFSLDDPNSFEYAQRMVEQIQSSKDEFINIILIGNKSDLHRAVYSYEARQFTEKVNRGVVHCRYIEVSAKDYDDVINMFHSLLDMMTVRKNNRFEIRGSFKKRSLSVVSKKEKGESKQFFEGDETDAISNVSDAININRSPSLISLNSFSSDEDIDNCNYIEGEEHIKKGFFRLMIRKTKHKTSPKSV